MPLNSSISHFAPAASISASNSSRSAFGTTGSDVPWMISSAALMSPGRAGALVLRSLWIDTAALRAGAGARQFEHVAAAEAEPDRRPPVIDQPALLAEPDESVVGGAHAPACFRRIVAQRVGKRRGLAKILRPDACAIHVGHEDDI